MIPSGAMLMRLGSLVLALTLGVGCSAAPTDNAGTLGSNASGMPGGGNAPEGAIVPKGTPSPGIVDEEPVTGANPNTSPASGGDEPILVHDEEILPEPSASGAAATPPICGNAALTSDEACDDGNANEGDGCSGDCLSVEPGYSCHPPGQPCRQIARCGDGLVAVPEPCDDGNANEGDGCSSTCKLEIGSKCEGSPSVCSPTLCGDGVTEGAESCDDGNVFPFDGCSSRCQAEPDCSQGACQSRCGDGLVIGESCDDSNNASGDGCAADCTVEAGFVCEENSGCEVLNDACVVRADAIFRDFTGEMEGAHPDFQGCEVLPVTPGLADTRLDAEGKPVLAVTSSLTACIASAASFAQWYRKSDGVNVEVPGILTLFDNGMGGFVNRFGPSGEPWTDAEGQTYDGSPLFFPLDGQGKMEPETSACVPGKYGDEPASYVSVTHNFHFTTEVTHWFKYDASNTATLAFTGDDDVWVYLNGILAVDLGGVHHPADGSVSIGPASAALFGLEDGNVYSIKVFQAERLICGSTFRLTLSGFAAGRSDCQPVCGDGIIGLGEECDDGVNDGGYGECAPGCMLTEFCGDGIVQTGEDCDDGNTLDGDTCGSACRKLVVRPAR